MRVAKGEATWMSPREHRIRRNEELFREVNAHIAALEERIRVDGELMSLICECANTGCTTKIRVDPGTFQAVRTSPMRFLVAAGHERADEKVIGHGAGYLIVEKGDPS
jgi:hypothetical protein